MTTTQTATDRLLVALQPALDAYGADLAAHRHAPYPADGCTCGWLPSPFSASKRRSTGLHIAAVHRAASKVYDEAAAVIVHEQTYGVSR